MVGGVKAREAGGWKWGEGEERGKGQSCFTCWMTSGFGQQSGAWNARGPLERGREHETHRRWHEGMAGGGGGGGGHEGMGGARGYGGEEAGISGCGGQYRSKKNGKRAGGDNIGRETTAQVTSLAEPGRLRPLGQSPSALPFLCHSHCSRPCSAMPVVNSVRSIHKAANCSLPASTAC